MTVVGCLSARYILISSPAGSAVACSSVCRHFAVSAVYVRVLQVTGRSKANNISLEWTQWPRHLRPGFEAGLLQGSRFWIPLRAWMCVCCVGSGLCGGLITHSEESYRVCVCGVWVCVCGVCVWCVYVCGVWVCVWCVYVCGVWVCGVCVCKLSSLTFRGLCIVIYSYNKTNEKH